MTTTVFSTRGARWALFLVGACLAASCATQDPEAPAVADAPVVVGGASVIAVDASRFDAGRNAQLESGPSRRAWVDALSRHLAERVAHRLAPGQRLDVRITDVQRAGDFEPWRGPPAAQVRIVRDIYPPRIDLSFKLRDERGAVLREGNRQLRDSTFLMRPDMYPNDPLRYEKALLDDWVREEFGVAGR